MSPSLASAPALIVADEVALGVAIAGGAVLLVLALGWWSSHRELTGRSRDPARHLLDALPIHFERAQYQEEMEYEEAAVDEDAEVDVDEMADEVGAADIEEDEYFGGGDGTAAPGEQTKLTDSILDASVDPAAL